MLDAAESHLALGEDDQARAMVGQAEAASRALRGSARALDVKALARIEQRLKGLREQLGKPR